MDESAIKAIAELATNGLLTVMGNTSVATVPKNMDIMSLERFADRPCRQRGTYKTNRIGQFTAYCEEWSDSETRIFVDPSTMTAEARIDHGDDEATGWGDHRAILTLEMTPAYTALRRLCGTPLTQQQLIDYLLDWSPQIQFSATEASDWTDMPRAAAIQAIRTLKVESGRVASHTETDTSRERSLLEAASVTSKPPAAFRLTCSPYRELQTRDITVRLTYKPESPPTIGLRILEQESLEDNISMEFTDALVNAHEAAQNGLAGGIHIGTYSQKTIT